jgi:hypothetical protein
LSGFPRRFPVLRTAMGRVEVLLADDAFREGGPPGSPTRLTIR